MDKRKENLLRNIIREYIKSAQPIGSGFLAETCGLDLSPATIRNEMAELEKEGYIYQPHTSAGRVPTEAGYRFYADNFLEEKELSRGQEKVFKKIKKEFGGSCENFMKELAKFAAEMSKETVFVGFDRRDVYYTGISNLFAQPEFREYESAYNISEVIDHIDDLVENIFRQLNGEVKIFIGRENPFSEACGAILTRYRFPDQPEGVFGILGPMRMDYENNVSLVKRIREIVNF